MLENSERRTVLCRKMDGSYFEYVAYCHYVAPIFRSFDILRHLTKTYLEN